MAGNREFVNRRLHSLLGVIPIGVFLTQHLIVNHFVTGGPESFNKASNNSYCISSCIFTCHFGAF